MKSWHAGAIGIGLGAAVLVGIVLWARRGGVQAAASGAATAAGEAAGSALAGAVSDAAGGFIEGAANATFGLPYTDADKCRQAKADGDWLAVSTYCPLNEFVEWAVTPQAQQADAGIDYGTGGGW